MQNQVWTFLSIAVAVILSNAPAGAQTVTVIDQRGVNIMLASPVRRIVTIPIPAASSIVTVDGTFKHLAGMHPSAKEAVEQGLLGVIFPEAKAIRSDISGQNFMPNIESLISAHPDVVVQWANQGPDLISAIEGVGIPVLGLRYGTEEYIRGALTMYGQLLHKEKRAAELIAYRDDVKARLGGALSGLTEEEQPRVMYLQRALGSFQVAGLGSYQDANIRLAGGRNVAANLGPATTVNIEQIIAWNPDVILLNSFESKLFPQDIYDNPALTSVNAVKAHRVYKLPLGGYRWDPPSQESPLTWLWQARLFHPTRVTDDLRAEMRRAYKLFYGYDLTDSDVDGILFLEKHRDAAGYEHLARSR